MFKIFFNSEIFTFHTICENDTIIAITFQNVHYHLWLRSNKYYILTIYLSKYLPTYFSEHDSTTHQSKNNLSNHRDQTSEFTHLSYVKPENIRLKPNNNNYQNHHQKANHHNDVVFKNKHHHRIDRVGYEYDYYDDDQFHKKNSENDFTKNHAASRNDLLASSTTTTEAANNEYEYYHFDDHDDDHHIDDKDGEDPDYEYFYYYEYEYVDPENLQSSGAEKLPKPSYRVDEKKNETSSKEKAPSNVQ